jgi:hypothetical protein
MPERPAPTISTSTCPGVTVSSEGAEVVLTMLLVAVCALRISGTAELHTPGTGRPLVPTSLESRR